jgi:hypothetical protein
MKHPGLWIPLLLPVALLADPGAMMGGGNFSAHRLDQAEVQFDILNQLGAGMCRVTVDERDYYTQSGTSVPERLDDLILLASKHHIEPMLLFEYYTKWNGPLGDHDKWFQVGHAFARRFAPNSEFLKSHGIDDWGIRFYSAINEPMWKDNNPTPIDPAQYAAALEGLADGVHSVGSDLRVSPGGFQEIPLLRSNRYGPAIAGLYNNGKLSAIDIHRYYDVQWQPMEGTYQNSLQNQFDLVKKQWGITADIAFYTTEFNFKKRDVTEQEAAAGFLTAIWDALGVTGNQGQAVTQFALPWNIFHTPQSDDYYGLTIKSVPWTPTLRGQVLKQVCELTRGTRFTCLDPRGRGVFVLQGDQKTIWVWQNRTAWTDRPGTEFAVTAIPEGTEKIDIYGFDGLRATVDVKGQSQIRVRNLAPEQTYMFVAIQNRPDPKR